MPIRAPWPSREKMKRDQIAKSGGSFDLVFVGDSITHGWENKVRGRKLYDDLRKTYSILNLGYSGNRTENMIWRLENGELDGYKAKLFMVMAGTNNKEPAKDVAVGVRRILDLIRSRQPQATILLLPIFPRGESAADARNAKNAKVNDIIRGFADGVHIVWCDFTSELRDSAGGMAGNLSKDRLHLNETGYAIWLRHVLPYFKRICGR
jgi:beta-glucosidase